MGNFLEWYCNIPEEKEDEDKEEEEAKHHQQERKTPRNETTIDRRTKKNRKWNRIKPRHKAARGEKAEKIEKQNIEEMHMYQNKKPGGNKSAWKNKQQDRRQKEPGKRTKQQKKKIPDTATTETKEANEKEQKEYYRKMTPTCKKPAGGNKNKPTMNRTRWIES